MTLEDPMNKAKIIAFAGSTREGSWNKSLARLAAAEAEKAGADATFVDLRDYPMPLYDADLEEAEGVPESVRALKQLFREADGFLIASPEYNSSISAVLKNTIDWLSRPESKDEPPLTCFKGKVAGLMSTSPGGLGGLRGLVHLKAILGNIGVWIVPEQKAIGSATKAFDDKRQLTSESDQEAITRIASTVVRAASTL